MTAEQIHEPAPDSHDVIHLGGQAVAVVVPMAEYQTLRALARRASARELAEAEDEAAVEDWQARKAAGQVTYVPAAEVRERLGLPAR
jgi:hypothetical protein